MRKWFGHEVEVEEKNPDYRCRCHQCGEEFMAVGIMMEGFSCLTFLLIKPKECPKCGSFKIMPVLFEGDDFYVESYERMWKEKEMRTMEQEKRCLRSEAKKQADEERQRE